MGKKTFPYSQRVEPFPDVSPGMSDILHLRRQASIRFLAKRTFPGNVSPSISGVFRSILLLPKDDGQAIEHTCGLSSARICCQPNPVSPA